MATEGGGKIKSKRQTADSRPYSRRQSLLGRMTNTVKDMLSPSWVIDLVNGVRKSPPKHLDHHESELRHQEPDGEIPVRRELNRMSTEDNMMSNMANNQARSSAPSTTSSNPMVYSQGAPTAPYNSYRPQAPIPQHIMTNGDDQSDASDYSAASSLIPQPDRKDYQGEIIQMNDSHIRQLQHHMELRTMQTHNTSADASNTSTNSAMEGSFLWSSSKPRTSKPQAPAKSQTPSFNSSLLSPGKGNSPGYHQSPYYPGKTAFGGAASFRRAKMKQTPGPYEPSPARKQVQARPLNNSSLGGVTSSTAKRILDTLERMSTPLSDAKKIPLDGNISDSVLSMTPGTYRRRRNPYTPLSQSMTEGPPTSRRTLSAFASIATNVHSVPTMKQGPQLQSMEGGSQEMGSEPQYPSGSTDRAGGRSGKMKRERGTHYSSKQTEEEEVEVPDLPTNFVLPVANFSMPPLGITVTASSHATEPKPMESCAPAGQQSSTITPSGFSFSSPIVKSSTADSGASVVNTQFQFSSPITVDGKTSKQSSMPPTSGFSFNSSSVAPKMKPPVVNFKAPVENNGGGGGLKPAAELKTGSVLDILNKKAPTELKSGSVMDVLGKPTPNGGIGGIQPASEMKFGSVMDILGKSSQSITEPASKPVAATSSSAVQVSGGSSLSGLFKKPTGGWTCDTCLILNKDDVSKCVACETPKPRAKPPLSTSSVGVSPGLSHLVKSGGQWTCDACLVNNKVENTKCLACESPKPRSGPTPAKAPGITGGSSLSSMFKKADSGWECDACLVPNKADVSKCVACETPKPGSKPDEFSKTTSTNGESTAVKPFKFGNMAKKSSDWECDTCLVNNKPEASKCVACEMPRPGAKPPTGFTSAGGFSFGVPGGSTAASAAGSTGGFKFGNTATTGDAISEPTKAFAPPSTGGFSFGKPSEKKEDSKEETKLGGFKFGQAKSAGSDEQKKTDKQAFGNVKFGGVVVKTATSENNNIDAGKPTGGFKFGQPSKSETIESKVPASTPSVNFQFGQSTDKALSSDKPTVTAGASPFQFGVPVNKDANANVSKPLGMGGFKFSTTNTEVKNDPPGPTFQFSAKPTEASGKDTFSASKPTDPAKPVFGATTSLDKPASATGGFSFGNTTAAPPASGGFVFGATSATSKADEKPAAAPVFSFGGTNNADTKSTTGSFTFTANTTKPAESANPLPTPNFSFNKSSTSAAATTATSPGKRGRDDMESGSDAKKPSVSFNQTPSISSGFKFGDAKTATTTSATAGFTFGQANASAFGTNSSTNSSTTGGFTGFSVGSQSTTSGVFGGPTQQTGSVFGSTTNAAPAFGSAAPAPAFGAPTTTAAPTGGMNLSTPASFNFGGTGNAAPASGLFQFSANTNQNNTAASAGGAGANFTFGGGAPSQPAAPAATPAPAFNATPSFNFTGQTGTGPAPVFGFNASSGGAAAGNDNPFSATSTSNNANNARRYKKAVRKLRK